MKETISSVCITAETKINMMKQKPANYLLLAIFGGLFIGFGILLITTIGGLLSPSGVPSMKIVQGLSFGVALSMVMMAGANLFTGDNLVLTVSTLSKKSSPLEMLGIWTFSYIGNFFWFSVSSRIIFLLGASRRRHSSLH